MSREIITNFFRIFRLSSRLSECKVVFGFCTWNATDLHVARCSSGRKLYRVKQHSKYSRDKNHQYGGGLFLFDLSEYKGKRD